MESAVWVCIQLRNELRSDLSANRSVIMLGRITLGIASLIICMVVLSLFSPETASAIEKMKWRILDMELGIATVLTLLMIPIYPGNR
jgi:hypothetical protein